MGALRNGQFVLVSCKLQRGAFSGECVVRLPMAGARGDYVGIAPVGHCLDSSLARLGHGQPPAETDIDGFIEAYLIASDGPEARIELPDGEAIRVPIGLVRYQLKPDQGSRHA